MTNSAVSLPSPAGTAARARVLRLGGTALALGLALLALVLASPASALVETVNSFSAGVAPRFSAKYLSERAPATYADKPGNPVLHGTNTWLIYWDPLGDAYHGDWQHLIDQYMYRSALNSGKTDNVYAVDTQYTDKSNAPAAYKQVYRGSAMDYHPYPTNGCTDPGPYEEQDRIGSVLEIEKEVFERQPVCLTTAQVQAELESYLTSHGSARGMNQVYYLLTPPGVTICLDGGGPAGHCSDYAANKGSYENSFCSYHSAVNPGNPPTGSASTVLYGVIPWSAGGWGDYHLTLGDELALPGYDCQDAGFNPANSEKEELEKVIQEPNQEPCPTQDGGCDEGLADLIVNQLSIQQENIVTDPLLNAWQDEHHYENTDECRFFFAPPLGGSEPPLNELSKAGTLFNQEYQESTYYVNDAFNYAAELFPSFPGVPCMGGLALLPRFTAPSPVNANETVGFDGMESDITQNAAIDFTSGGVPTETYATYTWNFGDGTPVVSGFAPGSPTCETPWLSPCAASVFHSYQYGGTYTVTLTVTDVGGNTAQTTQEVVVNGPPAPTSPGSGAPGSSGTGVTPSGTFAAPVAAATAISKSLRKVLKNGLLVRYSVNEQVAGRFEVLLSAALAKRLHVRGTPATGLPQGTPPQVVIAKAVLVTTKGGRSTFAIKFSKQTASRLSHLHKASLMLRLVVRNAASKAPLTTTVLSTVTLAG